MINALICIQKQKIREWNISQIVHWYRWVYRQVLRMNFNIWSWWFIRIFCYLQTLLNQLFSCTEHSHIKYKANNPQGLYTIWLSMEKNHIRRCCSKICKYIVLLICKETILWVYYRNCIVVNVNYIQFQCDIIQTDSSHWFHNIGNIWHYSDDNNTYVKQAY